MSTTSTFRKYDHLERSRHRNVQGVLEGKVHVFPKLDGTNASVWAEEAGSDGGLGYNIKAGSRNRVLDLENDNAGFCAWVMSDTPVSNRLRDFVIANPGLIVYGEWLVPHTLKTYREEAWRKFWIFDVYDRAQDAYLPWEIYSEPLECFSQDLIHPICTFDNPSTEQLDVLVEQNTYLIQDGAGVGEGIVCKNYLWRNSFGNQPWMKVVRNEFKEINAKAFGIPNKKGERIVESEIAAEFVDSHLVGKTLAKVVLDVANEKGIDGPNFQEIVTTEHRNKVIPQLLGRVFCDLVSEEIWAIVKKFKNPTINFKKLQSYTTMRVKALTPELF